MKLLPLLTSILVGRVLSEAGQCEEISIPMCKEIGYNFTRLPNQFNHESQDEVRNVLRAVKLPQAVTDCERGGEGGFLVCWTELGELGLVSVGLIIKGNDINCQ